MSPWIPAARWAADLPGSALPPSPAPSPGGLLVPLAHGVGSRHDLPVPPFYAFAGAFTALLVSFLGLGLLWSRSRFRGDRAGRALPAPVQRFADAPAVRAALRALGLLFALAVSAFLVLGPDDPDRNPAPGAVYVLLWAGLVPASLLLGPVGRLLNPLRALHLLACRALGRDPDAGRPLSGRLGLWPAAAGLAVFTWLELAAPEPASRASLLTFLTVYTAVHLTGAARHGSRWFSRADAFEVYSDLFARLSPLGRRAADGRLVLRSPFDGLDSTPQLPGLAAAVCVLLGSTAYDGFSDSPRWIDTLQSSPLGRTPTATLGLLGTLALVGALYAAATAATRLVPGRADAPAGPPRPGRPTARPARPSSAFAHSLVPIALGYFTAHYFTLLATEPSRTVMMAGGTDHPLPPEPPLTPGGLATLQVTAVVTGHVLGVIAAHDRSVRLFPPARAIAGQLPLLLLMIVYTVGGLSLLIT